MDWIAAEGKGAERTIQESTSNALDAIPRHPVVGPVERGPERPPSGGGRKPAEPGGVQCGANRVHPGNGASVREHRMQGAFDLLARQAELRRIELRVPDIHRADPSIRVPAAQPDGAFRAERAVPVVQKSDGFRSRHGKQYPAPASLAIRSSQYVLRAQTFRK